MSNLFKPQGSGDAPATPPAIDLAREKIQGQKKQAGMRGRAAALLVSGQQGPAVAQRTITGN